MPELPDIEIFSSNLNKLFAGAKLEKIRIVNGKNLKDSPSVLKKTLEGKRLQRIYRSGKEMRFDFGKGTLLGLHLMLTGDIILFEKTNIHHSTIAELYFDKGGIFALTDRMRNANIKLDPVDKAGVDAVGPELNYRYLKEAMNRKLPIKKLLTDQDIIRGIGNSYSDEILWQTRISPYSVSMAIPDEKIRELVKVIRSVLKKEIRQIAKHYPGKVNGEVKEFLQIHTKASTHSPTGSPIIIDQKGMMKTYYTKEQVMYR